MKSLHVIAGLDARNGGPSYSAPRLCQALACLGAEAELNAVRDCQDNGSLTPLFQPTHFFPHDLSGVPGLSALRLSNGVHRHLNARAPAFDIIHNHGLWLMPNVYAGWAAKRASKALVVSPRGMLTKEALKFSSRKKRLFWRFLQANALEHTAAWHATSADEAEDLRAFGVTAPIAIIPNGIDLPAGNLAAHRDNAPTRTLLFLSRIHPKKGLPALLEAWKRLRADRPEWRLIIAGPDENNHQGQLEAHIKRDQIPRVSFLGSVYGDDKDDLLRDADLFVLPTLSENFGLAVAEALAAGVPAVVTKGAPWAGLETERCGWWIDHGVEPLVAALRDATALPNQERKAMGLRGHAFVARDFAWEAIARDMINVYGWIAQRGDQPACVRIH